MDAKAGVTVVHPVGWRFKCGVGIFILKVVLALFIPILAFSGLSVTLVAAITGTIFIVNKLLMILMIAVMGKPGFVELKRIIGQYLPNMSPDVVVGPIRYGIGLFMFFLPIVSGMLEPYVDTIWPGLRPNIWELQLAEDVMLIVSVFVLGGNFWEKVRALFVRSARVVDTGGRPA
ncbi:MULTISPECIES: transporter suffix domain-containing protein [unclassified Rhizobium]|uniref:transporter suffix domain-containing protein n=1 Tax=unclassified Rhizobium TaxID=2613769 RepID=UPI001AD9FA7D|nr:MULTISPECIES: transporter suffix domain-containing protein [unclassified Rhizobium]MBO9102035.1 transporter suffix domain-containing protein [Rhizobium sp. L58/93]MBO9186704.1 transporter suffix domain-containing protein [Rhizobium sp. E27B/91]QXZ86137.1 transporter suffix domain-containing protein [Rhizobium sp. K1/93]QXZ92407.1 transporter suffix domain-containing protein [Rhizobium sp. K15/93]QYA04374.1 transporter suffix domain-containing protein [Rhizobium sp. B21/90]